MMEECKGSGEIERHMFYDHPLLILKKLTGGGQKKPGGMKLHCY